MPRIGLIGGPAGELYGATEYGGPSNAGVVYTIDASGETVLYSFTGGADGNRPSGDVNRDPAGNLYGTTQFGGAANKGVVYMLDLAGKETVLYSFTGGADGGEPGSGVIRDEAGNLYGTATVGGKGNAGVVFEVNPAGQETVLYSFTGGADGSAPSGGLIRSSAGDLYGTTYAGGSVGRGTVFKVDAGGRETVLHSFRFATGVRPPSGVIRDAAGNLYGATESGGSGCGQFGCGVVFKLDPSGKYMVLHHFTGPDGQYPESGVIRDAAGNLYGTTYLGGEQGDGVVYKVDPSGNETVPLSFAPGAGGHTPMAGVIRDAAGNLYGTTRSGGPANVGVVYKLDPSGVETVLHGFRGGRSGSNPTAGLIGDGTGTLYGTTKYGGANNAGVVYKLDAGLETVLYSFTGGTDGGMPLAGVIRDSAGNLYGTGATGGAAGAGVVFKVDPSGNETVLYSFKGGSDGRYPGGGVIRDAEGNLYGTTESDGTHYYGCVFKVDASGNETVLHSFTGADGDSPSFGVTRDQAGNLYGATGYGGEADAGVVYKLDGAGNVTVLYTFTGKGDGMTPSSGVILDSAGNLYGTTSAGGGANAGVVYEVEAGGGERVLYNFTGKGDGGGPIGGVARDAAGNFYGTASAGGASNAGVVYMLSAGGQESVLYNFTGGVDGGDPQAGVIRDAAGDLFGTTLNGGTRSGGVVFKVAGQ